LIIGAAAVLLIGATGAVLYATFSKSVSSTIRTAIASYLRTKVNEAVSEATEGKVKVDVLGFSYGFFSGNVSVDSVRVTYTDSTGASGEVLDFSLSGIEATGVYPWDVLNGGGLSLGTITVSRPHLRMHSWDSAKVEVAAAAGPDTALFKLPQVPNVDSLLNALSVGVLPHDISPLRIDGLRIKDVSMDRWLENPDSNNMDLRSHTEGLTIEIDNIALGQGQKRSAKVFSRVSITMKSLERKRPDGGSTFFSGVALELGEKDRSIHVDTAHYNTLKDYSFKVAGVHFSYAKQEISIDTVALGPTLADADYFATQTYNGDRFRINLGHLKLSRIDLNGLANGEALRVAHVGIGTLRADILSNKRLRDAPSTGRPKMPHELIRSVPFGMEVDSISVASASIIYGERRHNSATPAELRFSHLKVAITGVTNIPSLQEGKPLTISASGTFMEQAPMQATLKLPLNVSRYRLEASGSMGKLDITRLNSFLPIAENMRVEKGLASKASFTFVVDGLKARGNVDPYYTDLKVELLDKKSKKAGLLEGIVSFVANWIVIRNDNPAGEDHVVGTIDYTLPADAAIMQTLWFPIRAGLGKAAGF
jgi:hypothetical protein